MYIIKNSKIFLSISLIVILLSVVSVSVFGLKKGIDFTGGALVDVSYTGDALPSLDAIKSSIKDKGLGDSVVEQTNNSVTIKLKDINEQERTTLKEALSVDGQYSYTENSFSSVGPSIGSELTKKAFIAVLAVTLAIIIFITISFREVSKPVASWKYGLLVIATFIHDITIPVGLFAFLGKINGAEVDTLFVVAILTILGISVSDTIVIFDRIRENLKLKVSNDFSKTVGQSLSESFTRSINTSLTVVIVLFALFFFGPDATKNFALTLITGMIVGTYSSIFVASPLLVIAEKMQRNKK